MTTLAKHATAAETWTPDAWVTKCRATVAGGGVSSSGRGAILRGVVPTTASMAVGVGSRAGGGAIYVDGMGTLGVAGGAASTFAGIVAGGGGGYGQDYDYGTHVTSPRAGGDAGVPGSDGKQGQVAGTFTGGGVGGGAGGSGGDGGLRTGSNVGADGKSNGSGGAGGNGASYYSAPRWAGGGGGGGGFGGGGGGAAGTQMGGGNNNAGFGGGGGSSTFGSATDTSFVGYNTGAPYIDIEVAAAPFVSTPLSPTSNEYVNSSADVPLSFASNAASADLIDAITDAQVRYRVIATPANSWTTVTGLGTSGSTIVASGGLTAGENYEWQARAKADGGVGDAKGIWGPWSDSAHFRTLAPAPTPAITAPLDNATIGINSLSLAWTSPDQVSYQARIVGDSAGAANPAVAYVDTGERVSTAKSTTLIAGVNDVDAHVQVRVRVEAGGVWSQWADVLVSISWEPPPVARVTRAVDEKRGALIVAIVNPAPEGVQPDASVNRVFVTEGGVEQAPVLVAPSTTWTYWTPVGDVAVRVEAVDESTGVLSSTGVIW